MLTPEQLLANHKANLDVFFGLTAKGFEGVEKLVELNLQAAKSALGEAAAATQAALSAKDPQELLALQAGLLQPAAEKAAAYGRHVYDIAAGTSAEFGRVAESKLAEAQGSLLAAVDTASKNAPAGSENAVVFIKSALSAANSAYDMLQKAAKQAVDAAEANVQAMTSTAVRASQQATAKAKRAAAV